MSTKEIDQYEISEEIYTRLQSYSQYHGIFSLTPNVVEDLVEINQDI